MSELSLLDTPGMKIRDWYVVYHHRIPYFRFTKFLKPGFRHVELCRALQYGPELSQVMWLQILPNFEMLDAEVCMDPRPPWVRCPEATIQKVVAARPLYSTRQWFHIGPVSCVEIVKFALGINSFWLRTPWQLYKYIHRRGGTIISTR